MKSRAGREIGVVPVGEPEIMDAARMRPRSVEMRQLLRMRGVAHVVDIDAGVLLTRIFGLVRDDEDIAGETERVAADEIGLDRDLGDDGRRLGFGDVDDAEAHRRRFMREKQHSLAVRVLLKRQALAAFADTIEITAADDLHIACLGRSERIWRLRGHGRRNPRCERHDGAENGKTTIHANLP
ncbi:MAG TPA: hypothetical protein VGR70_22520 [Stellaceae bacterium]|nr:hypothetical protein [Stellaceae bacterium]